jgi:hypothetical protein
MKEKVSPLMLIGIGVLVLAGLGVMIWKLASGSGGGGEAPPTIVKPANPDDPKYKPDPRLGLGGGGA